MRICMESKVTAPSNSHTQKEIGEEKRKEEGEYVKMSVIFNVFLL